MSENARTRILEGALELLRTQGGGSITLDGAARQAGVTKPGLMYHFATKHDLMLAVVDHAAARWGDMLSGHLDKPVEQATPRERIGVYARVALLEEFDTADFALYTDALYRTALTQAWTRHFAPWLELPADMDEEERVRCRAVQLLADGHWTAAAVGMEAAPPHERDRLLALAERLLEGLEG